MIELWACQGGWGVEPAEGVGMPAECQLNASCLAATHGH